MKKKFSIRRPAKTGHEQDGLIPLINVVFLMLIFFLLAGTIAPSNPFQLSAVQSQAERRPKGIALELFVDARGQAYLGDDVVAASDLPERLRFELEQLGKKPEQTVAATTTPSGETKSEAAADAPLHYWRVRIRADQSVKASQLSIVMKAIQAAGVDEIKLMTQPRS